MTDKGPCFIALYQKSTHTQTEKGSTKSSCIRQMENLTFLLFWGYEWERIENISAEKAQKHFTNFERNEDVIRGLFVSLPAIPAWNYCVREITLRLSAFLFLSRICGHLSQFIFLPYTSFTLQGVKKRGQKKKQEKKKCLLKGKKSWSVLFPETMFSGITKV